MTHTVLDIDTISVICVCTSHISYACVLVIFHMLPYLYIRLYLRSHICIYAYIYYTVLSNLYVLRDSWFMYSHILVCMPLWLLLFAHIYGSSQWAVGVNIYSVPIAYRSFRHAFIHNWANSGCSVFVLYAFLKLFKFHRRGSNYVVLTFGASSFVCLFVCLFVFLL